MPYSHTDDIEVCTDCLALLANGEVQDADGNDVTQAHGELIARMWAVPNAGQDATLQIVPACPDECEGSFSWYPCEGCGSTLGGNRHPAAVFRYVPESERAA